MIQRSDLALTGRINKTHGIKGELSISFFNEDVADALTENSCLIMDMDGIFTPFFVKTVRPRSAEALLVTFDGYADQKMVSAWIGKDVYIELSKMPEQSDCDEADENGDGLYASQLVGYVALDENDRRIGEIVDIDDSTDNVLFVIQEHDKTVLVPIVDEFIASIDPESATIRLDLPDGMLQL